MNKTHFFLIALILVFSVACTGKPKDTQEQENSQNEVTNDSSAITEEEPYDWTPVEFKQEHYDEWVVVKQSIDIQQSDGDIAFSTIDSLVREYIQKKNIVLPKDTYSKIMEIDKICDSNFDISGYDDSNFGTHIADGTARLFDMYINWLLENAARKVCKYVNFEQEEQILQPVMDAFYACGDSIGFTFEGSGGWHGIADVHRMEMAYWKAMYEMFLTKSTHTTLPLMLTAEHFKKECDIRCANYKQDYEEFTTPQKVKSLLHNYSLAVENWLNYRNSVEKQISQPALRRKYSYNTRYFARVLYIHLKNKFADIGMISSYMDQRMLHLDCTDQEMLQYSYEEAYSKYRDD